MNDLLQAERQRRETAERTAGEMRKLLTEIGTHLAGERLQEVGRDHPEALQSWSASDWRGFFDEALKTHLPQTWGNGTAAKIQQLERELAAARKKIRALEGEQDITRQATSPPETIPEPGRSSKPQPSKGTSTPPQGAAHPPKPDPVPEIGGAYPVILQDLREWASPPIPTRFEGRIAGEPLQWRRQSKALFILARYGLNPRLELDRLIAQTEGIKPGSGSLRRAINLLSDRHIFVSAQLGLKSPQTRLTLVRLSKEGRQLSAILGWEPVESEWERLNRLHEGERFPEHTLAVLAVAMHARMRGYTVNILPEVDGPAAPDLLVEKDGQPFYVEVELGNRERPAKWRNLAALQGRVALCARDPKNRARLAGDCKLARLPGVATDLETLVHTKLNDITPGFPLWIEAWD